MEKHICHPPDKIIKLKYRYCISISICIINLLIFSLNIQLIKPISSLSSFSLFGYDFNITQFNTTCQEQYSIPNGLYKQYSFSISLYHCLRIINILLYLIILCLSISSMVFFNLLLRQDDNQQYDKLKTIALWFELFKGGLLVFTIVLYLTMFIRFSIIINYLEFNNNINCLNVNAFEFVYMILKNIKSSLALLAILALCALIIVIYFLKILLVYNNFFIIKQSTNEVYEQDIDESEEDFIRTNTLDLFNDKNSISSSRSNQNRMSSCSGSETEMVVLSQNNESKSDSPTFK